MTIPTDGRIDLDALAERLRREAQAFDNDLGSDPEADAGTARLLREAAGAIDLARRAAIPSEQGEAAGEAGTMPGTDGFTMAVFRAADVPVGTKLYAHPAPAAGVKVKALEWVRPNDDRSLSRAESAFGTYRVWTHAEAAEKWFWRLSDAPFGARPSGTVDNELVAKAAAQADYEARILSALDQGEPK